MIVPLSSLRPGERGVVVSIGGGVRARSKLVAMGLMPGAVVQVIEAYGRGPIIFTVGSTRLAMGRGLASRVLVRKI